MATTTPNYGWTVPTSTDLVKDGATAIETLGDAIDASMNTALGTKKAGMVLLNTTSFSGVASQAVNSVFSSTYRYYKVLVNLTLQTADGELGLKLRSGTTDASTSYYNGYNLMRSGGTADIFATSNGATYRLLTFDVALNKAYPSHDLTIFNPFETVLTTFTGNLTMTDTAGALIFGGAGGGVHEQAISYDGFNLIASAGHVTGVVKTYGYN
jgi:hypothetical protein